MTQAPPHRFPVAHDKYDRADEQEFRNQASTADGENHKHGRDIEVGQDCRAIFYDTVTSARYALTVVSGVLTLTPA